MAMFRFLVLVFLMVFSLQLQAADDHIVQSDTNYHVPMVDAQRSMTFTKKYLQLPVKHGAAKRLLRMRIKDELVREFVIEYAEAEPDYWRHLASWLSQRDNPDVHLLTFEEMKQDLRGVVERIAAFIGVDADDALLDLATQRSSFEFMSANKCKPAVIGHRC